MYVLSVLNHLHRTMCTWEAADIGHAYFVGGTITLFCLWFSCMPCLVQLKLTISRTMFKYRELTKSSSSSGEKCISCPAFKCYENLTIRDITHILFDDSNKVSLIDVNTLMNLINFNMDASVISHAKLCSTPLCTKIFPKRQYDRESDESQPGMNVYLWSCGTSMCNDCYQPAHFGMSCSDYKRVTREIDSGRIDDEYKR